LNWVPLQWTQTAKSEGGLFADNNLTSGSAGVTVSYSTLSAALVAHEANATQTEAYANMPTSGVTSVYVAPAEAMLLGLESSQPVNIYLNVNSAANWSGADGFSPMDAFAAIAHEITESAMGRVSKPGPIPRVMDMFRFSAPGAHDLTSGATSTSTVNSSAYFSIDDGATNLGAWTNDPGHGDFGDWSKGPVPDDAYGGQSGGVAPISEVDIELMNVLGWSTDVVTSGDTLSLTGGQTSSSFDVMAGGEVVVRSGGVTSDFTYTNAQQFNDGVLAPGSSGGLTAVGLVRSGGSEVSGVVTAGGVVSVFSGGASLGDQIQGGGIETLNAGATATALTVSSGGHLDGPGVLIGVSEVAGTVSGVTLGETGHAGKLELLAGGVADDVSVDLGSEIVLGLAAGATVSAGGYQLVSSGGVASATAVLSGGRQYVSSGGHASAAGVGAGGAQVVLLSGAASGTVIGGGGEELVSSGGLATATTLSSGGRAAISAGGRAVAATVSSGGVLYVLASGATTGTTVSRGGAETISAGGTELELGLLAGGVVVDNGEVRMGVAGALDGTLEGSGAIVDAADLVLGGAGAAFSGRAVIEGGVIELSTSGALGTGSVQFVEPTTGSAVLQIDAAPVAGGTFANVISNFSGANEDIDLRGIAFVSGASATIVGSTLVLTDGGKTYSFKLAGGVAGAYPVLSDGHGGTLIDPKANDSQPNKPTAVEPQPVVPPAIAFAQAAAAFVPNDASRAALSSSASPLGGPAFLHGVASAAASRF
jgi:autotransporter passenger strand-loop-strand repeat protein